VNATLRLLKQKTSPPKVLSWLIAQYRLSRRQAYRYLQQAQSGRGPLPIPEAKRVFTVKLSVSLIRQVRQQARREGGAISQWVEAALRRSLKLRQGHG
jgi:predicted HicB family RNase H-like nuclease